MEILGAPTPIRFTSEIRSAINYCMEREDRRRFGETVEHLVRCELERRGYLPRKTTVVVDGLLSCLGVAQPPSRVALEWDGVTERRATEQRKR